MAQPCLLSLLGLVMFVLASREVVARADTEQCDTPDIDIKFVWTDVPPAPPAATRFAHQIQEAIGAVCKWWGPTYSGPFHIAVNNTFPVSMALVPAWYGQIGLILFPDITIQTGNAATIHEVTHVFAPNGNRFLAEGLAVFAHEHLQGPPAYPNFGVDLKVMAKRYAGRADIAFLDTATTPKPPRLMSKTLESRGVYVVAGSFVRFLIEEFGLARFRELYATTPLIPGKREAGGPERWERIYGLPIDALSSRWRQNVEAW